VSQTLDINVLVYATHRASPFHQQANTLVERFLAGPELVYLF
jgi:predicted nucleic acid-binding protein